MPNRRAPLALTMEAVETPLGGFLLVADDVGILHAADFADCEDRLRGSLGRRFGRTGFRLTPGAIPEAIRSELAAYFAGDLAAIGRIPLHTGGTAFQDMIWNALKGVKPGQPITYSQMASNLGRPGAIRAVGHANGANPFCVIIPCHRLVGANGALTGYSGGIERKRWLLDHEASRAPLF